MPRAPAPLPKPTLLAGIALAVLLCTAPARAEDEPEFTIDWFTHTIPLWDKTLAPWKGRPDLHYLEIGVYEGRSLLWMLEHVLTHESARVTAIDPFLEPGTEARFRRNLEKSGNAEKVRLVVGYSQSELKSLPADAYDLVYVDGSHTADDVMADAVLVWPLLRIGGLVIFDDYRWTGTGGRDRRPLPAELRPQVAIDAFVTAHRNEVVVEHRGYQLILRKRRSPCPAKWDCSPLGPYLYQWEERRLTREGKPVALSPEERDLVERLLSARPFGQTTYRLGRGLRGDPAFEPLMKRLGLDLGRQGAAD